MAAGRLIFPGYMPAEDASGDRVPAAKAYFYTNLTNDLANTYTTSALSVANANPVVADSSGVWPEIWADTATAFTVALTDGDGAPLTAPWDGVSPAIDATLASVALAQDAADRAEAAANGIDTVASSSTTLTISTGSKAIGLEQTGKNFAEGMPVVVALIGQATTRRMVGTVDTFADPLLTVDVSSVTGSGSGSSWQISQVPPGGVNAVAGLDGDVTSAALKSAISLDQVDNTAVLGKQSLWIPAGAMVPRITNGPSMGTVETTTNKIMSKGWDFDQTTREHTQFQIAMPKGWDEGPLTAEFIWTCGVTGNVVWGIQGVSISNDDVLDAAFGTAVTVTDGVTAITDVMQSDETGALTLGGTPAAKDLAVFQVYRDAAAAGDTAAGDAKLLGVRLYPIMASGNDA